MTTTGMDPVFASALRDALIAHVEDTSRRRHRWRWRLGLGVLAGAGVLAGGVAVAATLLSAPPGGTVNIRLSHLVTVTRTGTATVALGPSPRGATGIWLTLTCLNAGTFALGSGGAGGTCSAGSKTSYVVPLATGETSITIAMTATASWRLEARYVKRVATPWGVNARGQTYGVRNKNGTPDLQAVEMEGNKGIGYVKSSDLACASGTDYVHDPTEAIAWMNAAQGREVAIPAYTSNGTTVIGSFVVGSGGPGIRIVPLSTIAKKFCQSTTTTTGPPPPTTTTGPTTTTATR